MKNNSLVSVIVLNWNGKDCIGQCLRSLEAQTYPNREIIVVDNASSDGSPELVKKEFPHVRLIKNDRNLGFSDGNNIGIKAARGDLIALFNYDAVAAPDWLSELVKAIMEKNNGLVGGLIYYVKPKDVIWAAGGKIDALTGIDWHPYQGERTEKNYLQDTDDIDFVPGCALLIKREAVDKIGLLDGDLFYFDDVDWSLLSKRVGYDCKFVSSAIVYHMVSFGFRENPMLGYYNHMRSKIHFYFKHFPVPYLVSSMFFQAVFTFFEIFFFKRPVEYATTKIQALIWNLHKLETIAEKRRLVKKIGKPCYRTRFFELLKTVKKRVVTRKYYW